MNNSFLNISGDWLNDTSAAHAFEGHQFEYVDSQTLLELCGSMDENAVLAAGVGIVCVLAYMFAVGRFRNNWVVKHESFLRHALLTTALLMFVVVIVRVMRGS